MWLCCDFFCITIIIDFKAERFKFFHKKIFANNLPQKIEGSDEMFSRIFW
jgi:hypothetical protein